MFLKGKTAEIKACKLHYLEKFNKLPKLTKEDFLKNYVIEFAYNTASMEGNTIGIEEARNLLTEGITPKDKTLREIYDLQNTEKVFMDVFKKKDKLELNNNLIINIHDDLLDKVDERKGYRKTDVRVVHSSFDATPGVYVKTDMDLLLKWFKENQTKLHPIVLAIIFHHKFEKIHPFYEGNGRTGRMLMNLILLKNNFPPIVIHKKTRADYLNAMRDADNCDLWEINEKYYKSLIEYGAEEFIQTYWNLFL